MQADMVSINRQFPQAFDQSIKPLLANFGIDAPDIMISDWSGVALEFAFGLEKPVIFIDVPRKILNQNYDKFDALPLEVRAREELGAVVSPDQLETIPDIVAKLVGEADTTREKIRNCRSESVYNIGTSGQAASNKIAALADAAEAGA